MWICPRNDIMACFNGFTVNVRDQKMRDNPTSLNSVSEIQISKNLASNSPSMGSPLIVILKTMPWNECTIQCQWRDETKKQWCDGNWTKPVSTSSTPQAL